MKAEVDRFSRERKEHYEQIQEFENQLEWLRSERDDEIGKLSAEKKALQDRLHDAENQLTQLKSRKRDELKVHIFSATSLKDNFFFQLQISRTWILPSYLGQALCNDLSVCVSSK